MAQSVEHFLGKEGVAGSSPVVSSGVFLIFFVSNLGFKINNNKPEKAR